MNVHQTLVWLNLLSFRTKGLTEPTIGIQSGLCHGRGLARTASQQHSLTTLIRHFVSMSINPASALSSCILRLAELSSQLFPPAPPHCPEDLPAGPVRVCVYGVCSCCRQGKQPAAGTHTIHTDTYRPGRQVFTSLTTLTQYCCDRQLGETVYAGLI